MTDRHIFYMVSKVYGHLKVIENFLTAFKTISMRIRGADTELQQAGLDTEGMAESTAKLRQEVMALSGVDIMKDENNFKSTYDILDELSTKWADLTDIQQASLTELIAGELITFARMYRNIHKEHI